MSWPRPGHIGLDIFILHPKGSGKPLSFKWGGREEEGLGGFAS